MKMFCVTNGKIGLCGKFVFWLSSTYGATKEDCIKIIQEFWEKKTVEQRISLMLNNCEIHN